MLVFQAEILLQAKKAMAILTEQELHFLFKTALFFPLEKSTTLLDLMAICLMMVVAWVWGEGV